MPDPRLARKQVSSRLIPAQHHPLLHGYPDFRRVDYGEFRIVYRYRKQDDVVEVILVAKRNDDEVYRRLRRLLG